MKKIVLFLATSLMITIVFGCSKDNVAPSFSKYNQTVKPVNLEATFFKNSVAKTDSIRLTWEMSDTSSVTNYLISWSDSSVFDLGNTNQTYINSLKNSFTLQTTYVLKSMGYITVPDTLQHIVYFTVSALYNNNDLYNFVGPRSVVDTATVNWK